METNLTKTELKTKILDRLEQEEVTPRSSLYFKCQELMVWVLWVFAVVVGALAVAVSLFTITYQKYAFYEATHDNFITFMVEVLPYLWFVILVVMILLSVFNVRHTKKGYRYPLWQIVISSLVFSFVGGYAMHFAGMGFMVDQKLGEYIAMYKSQEKMESSMWQKPKEGRLVGFLVTDDTKDATSNHVLVRDINDKRWQVNVSDLYEDDLIILNSGKKMKVLGQMLSIDPPQFYACGILPWMFKKDVGVKELSAERRAVIDRIYQHKDRSKERHDLSGEAMMGRELTEDYCGELQAVHRIHMTPN